MVTKSPSTRSPEYKCAKLNGPASQPIDVQQETSNSEMTTNQEVAVVVTEEAIRDVQETCNSEMATNQEAEVVVTEEAIRVEFTFKKSLLTMFGQMQASMTNMNEKLGTITQRLDRLDTRFKTVETQVAQNTESIEELTGDVNDLIEEDVGGQVTEIREMVNKTEKEMVCLADQKNKLERFSHRNNVRLVGYEENEEENCVTIVKEILQDKFEMDSVEIKRAHRVGKRREGQERLAKTTTQSVRRLVYSSPSPLDTPSAS